MSSRSQFGQQVRRLRQARGLSLRRVARSLGVSPTYLSKVERGELPPLTEERLVALADILDQDLGELLQVAGRVPLDVQQIIEHNPKQYTALVRALKPLASPDLDVFLRGLLNQRDGVFWVTGIHTSQRGSGSKESSDLMRLPIDWQPIELVLEGKREPTKARNTDRKRQPVAHLDEMSIGEPLREFIVELLEEPVPSKPGSAEQPVKERGAPEDQGRSGGPVRSRKRKRQDRHGLS